MLDYDKLIADAAREYVSVNGNHRIVRTEVTRLKDSRAWEKLAWMIEAERFGWNPEDYVPEF